MTILFERMEKEIKHLKALYDNASVVGSPSDIGRLREIFIKNLLNNVLPSSVEICSGVIFDSGDNRSNQQDNVIYLRTMPKLSVGEGPQLLFAEGVIATIEVKSKLDNSEFDRAMDNIKSVKSLNLSMVGGTMGVGRLPTPGIKCYVFAYDSVEQKSVENYVGKYAESTEEKYWFDQITILDKFVVYKNDGSIIAKTTDFPFMFDIAAKWTVLGFFIHLVNNLYGISLHRIDWSKYLKPPKS